MYILTHLRTKTDPDILRLFSLNKLAVSMLTGPLIIRTHVGCWCVYLSTFLHWTTAEHTNGSINIFCLFKCTIPRSTFTLQPRFQMKYKIDFNLCGQYKQSLLYVGIYCKDCFSLSTKHFKDCITKQQKKCLIFIYWCVVYRNVSHLSFTHTE